MNYRNYDEYMRNSMECPNMYQSMNPNMYSSMNQNMYPSMAQNMYSSMCPYLNTDNTLEDLERMYPDIYRVVYPMVYLACDNIRTPVTDGMLDVITDDIYDRVETDGRINMDSFTDATTQTTNVEALEENRQLRPERRRNRFLRDLIRILLIRELLRRRPRFPNRVF